MARTIISTIVALVYLQVLCFGKPHDVEEDVFPPISTPVTPTVENPIHIPEDIKEEESKNPVEPGDLSDEWQDYEEEGMRICSLTSSDDRTKASYECEDGVIWQFKIEYKSDTCIYHSSITTPSGEHLSRDTDLDCEDAQKWIEEKQTGDEPGFPQLLYLNLQNTTVMESLLRIN